ncbi:hypothetical protein K470DRAFT_9295 [Piedraia hortae CBS 480.64]|uniref:Uncharacterized protein n=1 Tax=Piedraia hortae CBS 480.64 TaxID=1314780 RepID=A0A6A7C4D5_9PEZI|nr:hypothetical protein K470DRAFT_9295 [Piedraia hortae CBS 480.64]
MAELGVVETSSQDFTEDVDMLDYDESMDVGYSVGINVENQIVSRLSHESQGGPNIEGGHDSDMESDIEDEGDNGREEESEEEEECVDDGMEEAERWEDEAYGQGRGSDEDEDEAEAEEGHGDEDRNQPHYSRSSRFAPPDPVLIAEPEHEYSPFKCEIDALFFAFYVSTHRPVSDKTMNSIIELVKSALEIARTTPDGTISISSVSKLKRYKNAVPSPETQRRVTPEGKSFHQISILDSMRMEACKPGMKLVQYPEILKPAPAFSGEEKVAANQMWHGGKWRTERQLLRPVDGLRLREGRQDVWISDVLELCTGEHAMFYGCEIHTTREQSALVVRAIKLTRARPTAPSSKKARLLLPIKEGHWIFPKKQSFYWTSGISSRLRKQPSLSLLPKTEAISTLTLSKCFVPHTPQGGVN